MATLPYRLDFFEDQDGDEPCLRWIKDLTQAKRHALGVAMEQILQHQGIGVCDEKAWGKQLGGGIFEFRLMRKRRYEVKQKRGRRVKKAEQVSLRVFCHAYGNHRILLLHGYDKGRTRRVGASSVRSRWRDDVCVSGGRVAERRNGGLDFVWGLTHTDNFANGEEDE
jgi:hypothetical protein